MQSESTEYSPYSPTTSFDKSPLTSRHGFHDPASGNQLLLEDDPFQGQPRGAVEPESPHFRDLNEAKRLRALGNAERNQQNTPVKAVIEYENALLPAVPKRDDDDGPVFKIVPSKPGRKNGQQLDQFPNGRHIQTRWDPGARLTSCRGLNPHSLSSACNITFRGFPSLEEVLFPCHYTSRLAHRLLSLLPRPRCYKRRLRPSQ